MISFSFSCYCQRYWRRMALITKCKSALTHAQTLEKMAWMSMCSMPGRLLFNQHGFPRRSDMHCVEIEKCRAELSFEQFAQQQQQQQWCRLFERESGLRHTFFDKWRRMPWNTNEDDTRWHTIIRSRQQHKLWPNSNNNIHQIKNNSTNTNSLKGGKKQPDVA